MPTAAGTARRIRAPANDANLQCTETTGNEAIEFVSLQKAIALRVIGQLEPLSVLAPHDSLIICGKRRGSMPIGGGIVGVKNLTERIGRISAASGAVTRHWHDVACKDQRTPSTQQG